MRVINASSFDHYPSWQGRGFQYEVDEMIKCLETGRIESNMLPHRASIDVVKIMDEVRSQLNIVYSKYE